MDWSPCVCTTQSWYLTMSPPLVLSVWTRREREFVRLARIPGASIQANSDPVAVTHSWVNRVLHPGRRLCLFQQHTNRFLRRFSSCWTCQRAFQSSQAFYRLCLRLLVVLASEARFTHFNLLFMFIQRIDPSFTSLTLSFGNKKPRFHHPILGLSSGLSNDTLGRHLSSGRLSV